MFPYAFAFLVLFSAQVGSGTELCKNSDWWFDIQSAKCRPCKVCAGKSWVMEPCADFRDTICVDLEEIGRSIYKDIERIRTTPDEVKRPKWHEMEGADSGVDTEHLAKEEKTVSKSSFEAFDQQWGYLIIVVLCITVFLIFGAIVIMFLRYTGRFNGRSDNRKTMARARLFSRDRLNTTEYMNNLATLDRRLAMDEILEKRKKAIFEPQLLSENVYTDEVFVDISGIPRNLQDDHEYEELDHRRCLLRMQEQQ